MNVAYTKGLHELGDGLHAYLQPHGGWGWSNAGLITAGGASMLVDTLFDLKLTGEMLDSMKPITDADPIEAAMNTHHNGDHCFGNQLLPPGVTIYATPATVEAMQAAPPQLLTILKGLEDPELGGFARRIFGPFEFEGIELRLPTETYEGRLELRLGGREVIFTELGPAHTASDSIAHVPDAGVVFTGDLLFVGGTPIAWDGTIQNWFDACEHILSLGAHTLVPGHGPVTDASGVRELVRYLSYVRDEARARFEGGMDAVAAADDIDLSDFAEWSDPERIAVNVEAVYRELDPQRPAASPAELFARMARWSASHSR